MLSQCWQYYAASYHLALSRQHDVVLMQAANNAHLQQMTAEENILPVESKLMTHRETVGVMGIGKQNAHLSGRPGPTKAMQRNAVAKHRQPGVTSLPQCMASCEATKGLQHQAPSSKGHM